MQGPEDQRLREGFAMLQPLATKQRNLTPIETLHQLFEAVWTKETCSDDHRAAWPGKHPSHGQCDVTALAFQVMYGGHIWVAQLPDFGPHWYNVRSNGEGIIKWDMTQRQFALGQQAYTRNDWAVERDALLALPNVAARYHVLRSTLLDALAQALAFATAP